MFVAMSECCEQDDRVMDQAIERDVFPFLRTAIVSKESFHKEVSSQQISPHLLNAMEVFALAVQIFSKHVMHCKFRWERFMNNHYFISNPHGW